MLIPQEKEKGGSGNPLLLDKDNNKVANSEVRMRKPFTFTI